MRDVTTLPEVQTPTFTEFNLRQEKGRPYFIRLHDSVVTNIERLLASEGHQIGILLGSIAGAEKCTITVEDFERTAKVEERIRSWTPRAGSGQKVVGCYRSHARPEFGLELADRALFERCFPNDARLLLQVKLPQVEVGTAMFFLGEKGQLATDQATVEFPFNLRELGAEEQPAAPIPVLAATPQPAQEPVAEPVPVAKSSGGLLWKVAVACIVLIASVVGLSGLHVLDGPNPSQRPAQPVARQPAPAGKPVDTQPVSAEPEPPKPVPAPTPAKAEKPVKPAPQPVSLAPEKTAPESTPAPVAAPILIADNRPAVTTPTPVPAVTQTIVPPRPEPQTRAITPPVSAPPAPTVRPSIPPAQTKLVPAAGPLTPPRPMRQTAPVVQDSVRRSMIRDVVVKVRVNVDVAGNVTAAESVGKGNPIEESLAGSAIAAVKRWQFEPGQRGDQKVPSDIVLTFTFLK